jgi:hypothetical protein
VQIEVEGLDVFYLTSKQKGVSGNFMNHLPFLVSGHEWHPLHHHRRRGRLGLVYALKPANKSLKTKMVLAAIHNNITVGS